MKKIARHPFLWLFCFIGNVWQVSAQCAMCRASLESNGSATQAEAVNDGIVYLMAIPYILVAVVAWAIYKLRTQKANNESHLH